MRIDGLPRTKKTSAAVSFALALTFWASYAFALVILPNNTYGLVFSGSARAKGFPNASRPFVGTGGLVFTGGLLFSGVVHYNNFHGVNQEATVTGASYTIPGQNGAGTMTLIFDPSGPGILGFHTLELDVSLAGHDGSFAGEINFSSHADKSQSDNAANVITISGYMHSEDSAP